MADIIKKIRTHLRGPFYALCTGSLRKAAQEQGLSALSERLEKIVPDITEQYSTFKVDTEYLRIKVRNMHAFQISLINEIMGEFDNPSVVDIGDSSGAHLEYLLALYSHKRMKCLSVNLDEKAVIKIRKKGLEAVNARAEDLAKYDVNADIFLCFEVLEHLMDPCKFLHELASKTKAKYFIITVPYVKTSRVGLSHIWARGKDVVTAESAHIFELNPRDWKLLVKHCGWGIVKEMIYFQYPRRQFLRMTKPLWCKFDFEGFYGLILKKDDTYSSKYLDW